MATFSSFTKPMLGVYIDGQMASVSPVRIPEQEIKESKWKYLSETNQTGQQRISSNDFILSSSSDPSTPTPSHRRKSRFVDVNIDIDEDNDVFLPTPICRRSSSRFSSEHDAALRRKLCQQKLRRSASVTPPMRVSKGTDVIGHCWDGSLAKIGMVIEYLCIGIWHC